MPNPNVGILEEIDDQHLGGISIGAEANPNSFTLVECWTVASWIGGNEGWACTVTVECQANC